jgi:hypothetical protein
LRSYQTVRHCSIIFIPYGLEGIEMDFDLI